MEVFLGKSSINGPFSVAMLNNQRVQYSTILLADSSLNMIEDTVGLRASSHYLQPGRAAQEPSNVHMDPFLG